MQLRCNLVGNNSNVGIMNLQTHPSHPLIIEPLFGSLIKQEADRNYYQEAIRQILRKILPDDFFQEKETETSTREHRLKFLNQTIPLIVRSELAQFPGVLSFFSLSRCCSNSFKFFLKMISRWLIPGQRLNVILIYAADFCLPNVSDETYSVCEIIVRLETMQEFLEVRKHFPIIAGEIALGIHSSYLSQRILEFKGLSVDEKISLIQGYIVRLVQRFPAACDMDVLTEMQYILVTCSNEFKAARQARHLSRIIGMQYFFRKALRDSIKKKPHHRHLNLKIFRAVIQHLGNAKKILGIVVGINLSRDQEVFEDKHLIKAINHYVPSAQAVEHTFFLNKSGALENIYTFYMEIEKKDGSGFTSSEIRKLQRELPADLKNCIEHKLYAVFMPRNEEEVMRNLLSLSNQIKYKRDIPQVFISFDEQAYSHLFFTVILARVLKPGSCSILELFKKANTFSEYIHERTKIMGYIRNKYAKEASVFRLKLPMKNFLRADHSIDLYKARQSIVAELSNIVGEVRDYNGGMLSKQHEQLADIQELLASEGKEYNGLLLENFFYSLSPVIVRALVDPVTFKTLFIMLLDGIKEYKQEGYYFKHYVESYNIFALVITEDLQFKDTLNHALHDLYIPPAELGVAYTKTNGNACIGYICCAQDPAKKELFLQVIQDALQEWKVPRRN